MNTALPLDLQLETSHVMADDAVRDTPVARIEAGMHVRVRPGERISVDGALRADTVETVIRLHELGIRTAMLTGDNERTANISPGARVSTKSTPAFYRIRKPNGCARCSATRASRWSATASTTRRR